MRRGVAEATYHRELEAMPGDFNAQQALKAHAEMDDLRFGEIEKNTTNIWRVLAFAGVTLVAVLGWSLQAQYANTQKTIDAIQRVQATVSSAPISR